MSIAVELEEVDDSAFIVGISQGPASHKAFSRRARRRRIMRRRLRGRRPKNEAELRTTQWYKRVQQLKPLKPRYMRTKLHLVEHELDTGELTPIRHHRDPDYALDCLIGEEDYSAADDEVAELFEEEQHGVAQGVYNANYPLPRHIVRRGMSKPSDDEFCFD